MITIRHATAYTSYTHGEPVSTTEFLPAAGWPLPPRPTSRQGYSAATARPYCRSSAGRGHSTVPTSTAAALPPAHAGVWLKQLVAFATQLLQAHARTLFPPGPFLSSPVSLLDVSPTSLPSPLGLKVTLPGAGRPLTRPAPSHIPPPQWAPLARPLTLGEPRRSLETIRWEPAAGGLRDVVPSRPSKSLLLDPPGLQPPSRSWLVLHSSAQSALAGSRRRRNGRPDSLPVSCRRADAAPGESLRPPTTRPSLVLNARQSFPAAPTSLPTSNPAPPQSSPAPLPRPAVPGGRGGGSRTPRLGLAIPPSPNAKPVGNQPGQPAAARPPLPTLHLATPKGSQAVPHEQPPRHQGQSADGGSESSAAHSRSGSFGPLDGRASNPTSAGSQYSALSFASQYGIPVTRAQGTPDPVSAVGSMCSERSEGASAMEREGNHQGLDAFDQLSLEKARTADVEELDDEGWRIASTEKRIKELGNLGEGAGGAVTKCMLKGGKTVFALKVSLPMGPPAGLRG